MLIRSLNIERETSSLIATTSWVPD